jgi:hypothetical protein
MMRQILAQSNCEAKNNPYFKMSWGVSLLDREVDHVLETVRLLVG